MFTNQNNLSLLMLSMHSGRNLFRPKVQGMDILGELNISRTFPESLLQKALTKESFNHENTSTPWARAVHFWLNVFVRKSNETALGT